MENEKKEMDFGKKYRAGNFEYFKTVRGLNKRELRTLREEEGVPKDVHKHLQRGRLPFITVQTVSRNWSVSFVCGSEMYRFIECEATCKEKEAVAALQSLFLVMYCDTNILADGKYLQDKTKALQDYMDRVKAKSVSQEQDEEELNSLRKEGEDLENIKEMADMLKHAE